MRRILLVLAAAALMAVMMVAMAAPAFAAKSTTFDKGACTTKAGQGGGSGEIKDQHHGACNSNGASF
jgi:phage baseplate assembly protein gpV